MHKISDGCISTFTQISKIIQDTYDNRDEYEKDIWDVHKLGATKFGANRQHLLDFTKILQPWMFKGAKAKISSKAGSSLNEPVICCSQLADWELANCFCSSTINWLQLQLPQRQDAAQEKYLLTSSFPSFIISPV